MNALAAPNSLFTRPLDLFGRLGGQESAAELAGGGRTLRAPEALQHRRNAPAVPADDASVMAQISEMARSVFDQMRKDGIVAQSFDLHLDLERLGVKVDSSGRRSMEGHSLTVDLHVEAAMGEFQTEQGTFSFESLEISFEMTETHMFATQSGGEGEGEAAPARMGGAVEGLKSLAELLNGATEGEEQDTFDLDDMLRLLDDKLDQMHTLLAQIGKGFEGMAARQSADAPPPPRPATDGPSRPSAATAPRGEQAWFESTRMQLDISIKTLSFTRAAPPAPALDAAEPKAGAATELATA